MPIESPNDPSPSETSVPTDSEAESELQVRAANQIPGYGYHPGHAAMGYP